MDMKQKTIPRICALALFLHGGQAVADGVVIDKIYHPYVQPLEQEFEYRSIFQNEQSGVPDNFQLHRFAYGRSVGERWFLEFYLSAAKSDEDSFELEAYEAEAKWQLTEQGEYWADAGLLFELEREANEDVWEFSTALLAEKEWGKWSGRANLFLSYEWGDDIANEWETQFNLQARYRWLRTFEPAVEFYSGQNTVGIGPAVLGQVRLGARNQMQWQAGLIFGLDDDSPDRTFRIGFEFEF